MRIVGEPIWAGRTDEEYPACAEHEALINVALGDVARVHPVPVRRSEAALVRRSMDATRTHPMLASAADRWTSPDLHRPRRGRRVVRHPAGARSRRRRVRRRSARDRARGPRGSRARRRPDARDGRRPARRRAARRAGAGGQHPHALADGPGLLEVWTADDQLVLPGPGRRPDHGPAGRAPPAGAAARRPRAVRRPPARDLVRIHRESAGTTVRVLLPACPERGSGLRPCGSPPRAENRAVTLNRSPRTSVCRHSTAWRRRGRAGRSRTPPPPARCPAARARRRRAPRRAGARGRR